MPEKQTKANIVSQHALVLKGGAGSHNTSPHHGTSKTHAGGSRNNTSSKRNQAPPKINNTSPPRGNISPSCSGASVSRTPAEYWGPSCRQKRYGFCPSLNSISFGLELVWEFVCVPVTRFWRLVAHLESTLKLLKFDYEYDHRYHCSHQGSPYVHNEYEEMSYFSDHNRRFILTPGKERLVSSARISPPRSAWPEKTTVFDQNIQMHISRSRDQEFDGRFLFSCSLLFPFVLFFCLSCLGSSQHVLLLRELCYY